MNEPQAIPTIRAPHRSPAWVPLLSFVVLGLPAGILGVAWPHLHAAIGVPIAALGLLLVISTVFYFLSAMATGPAAARVGVAWLLVASCCATGAGCALLALAGNLAVALGGSALIGLGSGTFDAGINAFVSLNYGVRLMGWLHSAWALGAALGPLLVAASLQTTGSWRLAYAVGAVTFLATGLLAIGQRRGWPTTVPAQQAGETARGVSLNPTRLLVRAAIPFFLFAGLEMVAGQWSYSQLTIGRGVSAEQATLGVSLFWGGLAVGRALLGVLGNRLPATRILDIGVVVCVLGASLYWLAPPIIATFIALPAIGLGVSVLYPVTLILTPARVGPRLATHAIGYQIAAGTVGGAAIPAAVGIGLQWFGQPILGPATLLVTAALLALHLVDRR